MIARVEPLTRTRAIRGPFDYRLRPDQADIAVGSLLRVPFGGRPTLGVVVGLASRSELAPDRLAEPEAVLPAVVPPDLVALAEWMAREYCSTPSRSLALLLAPGATVGARPKEALVAEVTGAGAALLADAADPPPGETPTDAIPDPPPRETPTAPDPSAREAAVIHNRKPLTRRQHQLLATLRRRGPTIAAELGTPALRRLELRGLVKLDRAPQPRRPHRHVVGTESAIPPPLTHEQRAALDPILQALADRPGSTHKPMFLLHGVTGSGKTEIYLRAVDATLRAGRSAIVLVPEIALTPQAVQRFEARLGDLVAVMHSGMGQGERHDEWLRLVRGAARVCVGPRSAVFAPLSNIGLVIVDEEHESSYKHEGDPRYDARTVAERRARDHNAVLLLGSATPRPESTQLSARLRLSSRIDQRPLPPVEILDMRGQHHPLHPITRMALADLRREGGKGIVLLNRRGWSNFLSCRSCGSVWMCPHCEVALVLHRDQRLVACHHCGHRQGVPGRCPDCASVAIARHGAGTERIERELAEAIGGEDFPVLRLDADSAGVDARARTLERFHAVAAGLLVGTQMVAKGHDFSDVSLGIVLDADQTLRFPDFRAEERTFALLTQLAGRVGRGTHAAAGQPAPAQPAPGPTPADDHPGHVLVQTLAPTARSIRFASHHDSDGFLADELARRKALGYPPFASLIRVVCSASDQAAADAVAGALRSEIGASGAHVLGPAPLFRLRNRARAQILLKASNRAPAIEAVGTAVDEIARAAVRQGVNISVDVDPV